MCLEQEKSEDMHGRETPGSGSRSGPWTAPHRGEMGACLRHSMSEPRLLLCLGLQMSWSLVHTDVEITAKYKEQNTESDKT